MVISNEDALIVSQSRAKARTLKVLLAYAFVQGACLMVIETYWPGGEQESWHMLLTIVAALVASGLFTRWFWLDALEREFKLSKVFFIWLFALSLVAAPWYFFRTRGRKAWIAIWRSCLFMLPYGVSAVAGMLVSWACLYAVWLMAGR